MLRNSAAKSGHRKQVAELNTYGAVLNRMLGSVTEGRFDKDDVEKALEGIRKKFSEINKSLKEGQSSGVSSQEPVSLLVILS